MRFEDLKSARTGILGAGREGQAVWRNLRRLYPEKKIHLYAEKVFEEAFTEQLDPAIDIFSQGPFNVDDLKQHEILVRSAGISPYRSELGQLRSLGVRFTTASNLWFAENPEARTICVSGTKGKSTTSALLAHLLNAAGTNTQLAGNIGKPMLDCDSTGVEFWVIELSSYQIADLKAKPEVVVLLNLSDEHVDWHGSADRYRADKLRLVDLVGRGGLIVNHTDAVLADGCRAVSGTTWFNHPDTWQASADGVSGVNRPLLKAPPGLPGQHNMQNLAAVLTVIDHLGLHIPNLTKTLNSFSGLPHRLQLIGEKSGIRYIDDSISTTPVSVLAALRTFDCDNTVLLLGGMDRGLDWTGFAAELAGHLPHAIIALPDNGVKILEVLKKAGLQPEKGLHSVEHLSRAVKLAQTLVPEKGSILLSPGAPSFPHFRDFEDRGIRFAEYAGVNEITGSINDADIEK